MVPYHLGIEISYRAAAFDSDFESPHFLQIRTNQTLLLRYTQPY